MVWCFNQAYQHNRAVLHGNTDLAAKILIDDDPYTAMNHGKYYTREPGLGREKTFCNGKFVTSQGGSVQYVS